ncbi:DUF928 domain-containing protein [Aetokthonos hydrillicola Thurmond2011]|uniref:DUF928 domain-containing protein n=1 Tax=Aetokthonos hydrillicola Thurmond2011 TaxID=2712845 RepID=A0AAP5I402_9CYAN|nr:hypothetical protein [Aetokthonos hydrillicola]MBO3458532.1 hypothetical protein [Aetokthonos hydrillicola CCALA 1050]MBW4584976.1 DUF928 domain-containing protein [Aetokthonos hydrillicola CCALA 1050]MDR9894265.1 DUF928 domain-containing protein [Aetokthonos hydrillicola Thurmond2011]
MRDLIYRIYRRPLPSLVLVSFIVAASGISSAISAPPPGQNVDRLESGQRIAQTTWIGAISSFWQRNPHRRRLVSRTTGVCPISPGLIDTYLVWSEHPLFLWNSQGKTQIAKLIVREEATGKEVWTKNVKLEDQKAFYQGEKALELGKRYQWQLVGNDNLNVTLPTTFQIMKPEDHKKIQTALDGLEQKLKVAKASPEEIALQKADFFANYNVSHETEQGVFHPWSDALAVLYTVDKPSPDFLAKRQAKAESFCK